MNRGHKITVAVAAVLLFICATAAVMTRGVMDHLPYLHSQKAGWNAAPRQYGIVDQRPWQTARTLAALAVSTEELEFAREAERLSDHEVDQAFAQSLRQASAETPQLTGNALTLQRRVMELEQTVKEDQARVNAGVAAAAAGKVAAADGDDLDVARAQLSLDQDELADSREDLARASGDQRGKIQQELSTRQAEMKKYQSQAAVRDGQTAVEAAGNYPTLAGQISAWYAQRNRRELIDQAEQLARADVAALTADHARLAPQAQAAETAAAAAKAGESGAARVKDLQNLATQRNILSILDDRLGAQQQLVTLYTGWGAQVELQHKIVLHLMLQSLAWIALIAFLTAMVGWALQVLFDRVSPDRRQRQTLRIVLNLGTQAIGLVLVLLVVFGTPAQTPTILGLATAGLTVVFQDFILAFCGWFVLMGRNGVRVGDWVEIDGVGGEVVQIGLFKTWLLETGNWTANGHPTGRRVSFMNGFAIRGKYFNFSTAGQWMWDEIKLNIPQGAEAYPLIDKIRAAAVKATEDDVKVAEAAWKRIVPEEGLTRFSALPAIDLQPAGTGVDIVVRYVTRAALRLETRNRLLDQVVELMMGARILADKKV
jgi:small-conductance mechanosensitive channel